MSILDDLTWRGAINQQTNAQGLEELVNKKAIGLYCGVDPTGDSMHIGHLIPFMILKRFQLAGHKPVVLIGGGTGSIGDPSGRNSERTLQTMDVVKENARKLADQMNRLFLKGDVQASGFRIVNNYDWLSQISLLDFLRDYGKHFNINNMLAKDVVASRLEVGISFTEFSYQILQSIDFAYLYKEYDVQLQIGGADQWGNITAGLIIFVGLRGMKVRSMGWLFRLCSNLTELSLVKQRVGQFGWIQKKQPHLSSTNSGSINKMVMWLNSLSTLLSYLMKRLML